MIAALILRELRLAATGGAALLCGAILYVLTAFNGPSGGRHRPGRHRSA